ncbi:hypothetical protein HY948_04795 [Candidatus Gottesmanbacteria bacterium]|nr:hypothetical protein [Candidatus Gottesmanbacteria bacterium]
MKKDFIHANVLMVGGAFAAQSGAYLYHLLVGRMLPPSEYGILQSLISLSNIITVPLVMLNMMMVKFVAQFAGFGEHGKINFLYYRLTAYFWKILVIGGIIFLIFSGPVLSFLHISSFGSFVFLDIALFFGLLQILNRSIIQGISKFFELVVANVIESYGKLALGILAVLVGWGSTGAFGAFVLAGVFTYLYTLIVIEKNMSRSVVAADIGWRRIGSESVISFIMTMSMIAFFNVDVVLVRHFLPGEAGTYAALSVLGKIIYFGSAPIANTMLPLVSAAYAKGDGYHKMFLYSLGLTALLAGGISFVYWMFPEIVIRALIGAKYVSAASYLPMFGLFLSVCALVNVVTMFYFGAHKATPIFFMPVAAVAQASVIWFFHSTLANVIGVSLAVTASLLGVLLLYYAYAARSKIALRYHSRL